MVEFDESRALIDAPYLVMERVHGNELGATVDQRHWTAPPASRLLGVLRLFASAPPSPWADLT